MSKLMNPKPVILGRVVQPEICHDAVGDNECPIHGCCAICLDNLCVQCEDSSATCLVTRCGHSFHTNCLSYSGGGNSGTRQQKCPTCRSLLCPGFCPPDTGVQEAHEESLALGVDCLLKFVGLGILYYIVRSLILL